MERRRRGSRSREAGAHRQSGRAHRRRVEHPRREVCYGLQRVLRWRPASAAAAANGRQENRSGEAVGEHTELNRNYVPRIALSGYRGPSTRPHAVAGCGLAPSKIIHHPSASLRAGSDTEHTEFCLLRSFLGDLRASVVNFHFYGWAADPCDTQEDKHERQAFRTLPKSRSNRMAWQANEDMCQFRKRRSPLAKGDGLPEWTVWAVPPHRRCEFAEHFRTHRIY